MNDPIRSLYQRTVWEKAWEDKRKEKYGIITAQEAIVLRRHIRRSLPIPEFLNKKFKGSEAHHLTSKLIVYIPKKLHNSVRHNLSTGEGMEELRYKIIKFFENL